MSLDGTPWETALAWAPLVGHLYHFVLVVNATSALGYSETTLGRLRFLVLVVFTLAAAWLGWLTCREPWWTWAWPTRSYMILCMISGFVIGPLGSLRLALKKQPEGVAGTCSFHRAIDRAPRECYVGQGSGAWMLRLPGNQSLELRVHEWEVGFADLPEALDGLRILQLSDLHFSECYARAYFDWVIDHCRDRPADLVVVTGDVVEELATLAWIEPVLGRLEARLGKLAILGNHDHEYGAGEVGATLESAGYELLEGRWRAFDVDGSAFAIGGTSAPWGPRFAAGDRPEADFRLLLSHTPDLFPRAPSWGVDLMLSGHNHGGQIRFPLVGPIFMPSRYSRRFDRGFFRAGRTLMYASLGLGGKHPVRYGCIPEIAWFTLRRR